MREAERQMLDPTFGISTAMFQSGIRVPFRDVG